MASTQNLKINCRVPSSVSTILSALLCPSRLQRCTCFNVSSLPCPGGALFNALQSLGVIRTPWHWLNGGTNIVSACLCCCAMTFESVIVGPQLKLIVMNRKEGTAINLQLNHISLEPKCTHWTPRTKIRNVLNVLVCQILLFFCLN